MRFIIGNVVYEFKVAQSDSPAIAESDAGEFQIDLKYRKFQARSRSPEIELRRSLRFPHSGAEASMATSMSDLLQEFEVPDQVRENMATHFRFCLERLSRWNSRRSGVIMVTTSVDVREISPEKAAEVHRRMETGRGESDRPVAPRSVEAAPAPAKRSAVEALARERVSSGEGGEERECGICLDRMVAGEEMIRMPCLHVYHMDCIIRWLDRNHFCPFCHFKLPC